ncbi:MAG: glucuronate isomerase [Spirochaetes bacterium DG_61]|nr:MAG: glucuronate isomerase [Spirochaetes bacterium DG_61]
MTDPFITENFLLQNETARGLYFEFARNMPIFDYHSHLPVREIAEDAQFLNIVQLWLSHDHYKWRAMRANGIDERYITGVAEDYAKFKAWAKTVPYTVRNPLYHWTHLELKTYFHVEDMLLNSETAARIYSRCNEVLKRESVSSRNLLKKTHVKVLCTTDDPADSLDYHRRIAEDDSFDIEVLPTFRPDRAFLIEEPIKFNEWISRLEEASESTVGNLTDFVSALRRRHDAFQTAGCRSADHGLEYPYTEPYTIRDIERIFDTVRCGKDLTSEKAVLFKSYMLRECAQMTAEKHWVQHLHLGALRNSNTRYMKLLGSDSGFDGIGDFEIARPLVEFLDYFERKHCLPKTVLYNINPCDNELVVSIAGCFQGGSVPSKIQFGPGWWFNDTKEGMIRQMNALSNLGLFSRFIGMTTDSRSFLSFSRHDYFRRILCNLLGEDVEKGELPKDMGLLGSIVQDICYNNASSYFRI